MKKTKIIVLTFLSTFYLSSSLVQAGSGNGLVSKILIHGLGGEGEGTLIFRTETHIDAPSCNTAGGGLEWAISLERVSGRAMLSAVLSAQAQELPIQVHGSDACNDWGDREQPRYIVILK